MVKIMVNINLKPHYSSFLSKKSFIIYSYMYRKYKNNDNKIIIIASFGGLIGVCTGFSFLSLAEIFYFFTLRCTLPLCRKRKKGHQSGNQVKATDPTTELVVVQIDE